MVTKYTWPNFRGSDYDGVKVIIQEMGIEHDVEYGKSRIFIRSPQTLFALEEAREKFIPPLVMFLQRVSYKLYHMVFSPRGDITPCMKIDKPLEVYTFM